MLSFEFVSAPPMEALAAALEHLYALGALDKDGKLSPTGQQMARLPLEPSYAKALLRAADFDCALQMLSLVAMLSVEGSAFVAPPNAREKADEARARFACPQADTVTLVNVLAAFGSRSGGASRAWCEQNCVNRRTVEAATKVRAQLADGCARLGVLGDDFERREAAEAAEAKRRATLGLPHVDADKARELRRCMTAAFFLNAAQRQPTGEYLAIASRESVAIHPSSVLFQRRAPCVLYNEMLYTTKLYMRDLTQIDAEWLPELAPQSYVAGTGRIVSSGGARS